MGCPSPFPTIINISPFFTENHHAYDGVLLFFRVLESCSSTTNSMVQMKLEERAEVVHPDSQPRRTSAARASHVPPT